jgi:anti-sigma regulatory factor (Ser/Thr protein kinase)
MAPTMTPDIADTKWEQCVIRSLPEVPSLLGSLLEVLRLLDYSEKELFGVHLSVEELIVNAIKHGNGENPLKTVQIRYRATAQEFVIEIHDEGAGSIQLACAIPWTRQTWNGPAAAASSSRTAS